MADPFEELLCSNATSSVDTKPLFSPKSASTRRTLSQSIILPKTPGSTSASHVNATAIMTPPSASSEFGAFVSVPPSHDPLGVETSLFSPTSELFSTTGTGSFVEAAKRRTEVNERRIMDELLNFEEDPASLIKNSGDDDETALIDLSPEPANANETHAIPIAAPHGLNLSPQLSFSLEEAMSTPSPHERNDSGDLHAASAPQYSVISSSDRDLFPTLPKHDSSPKSNHDASNRGAGSLSKSPSFSSYISNTLPRKWSTLLRSPSGSSLARHNLPPHAATTPTAHAHAPAKHGGGLTHDSPFAEHPYIPPSGAPGFGGDRNWDKGFEFTADQKVGRPVELVGRNDTARPVLSYDICQSIRLHLPPLFRLAKKWTLLYSLDQHGISLATFYSLVSPHCAVGGSLLVVRDAEDQTFGVWVGDGIRKSPSTGSGRNYYGSGESFLWKQEQNTTHVQAFKWTGKNDYVALCESDYVSFGGGDGKYGLFLDSSFCDGTTATCPTFDNEPLCGPLDATGTARFECVGLEAWGIAR